MSGRTPKECGKVRAYRKSSHLRENMRPATIDSCCLGAKFEPRLSSKNCPQGIGFNKDKMYVSPEVVVLRVVLLETNGKLGQIKSSLTKSGLPTFFGTTYLPVSKNFTKWPEN
jgi:hypothetical protein